MVMHTENAPLVGKMVKHEWTKKNTAEIKALINHPKKSERWHWVSIEMGTRFKTCLVDASGRLWEFKIANGPHIRPMWNDNGPQASQSSAIAANG